MKHLFSGSSKTGSCRLYTWKQRCQNLWGLVFFTVYGVIELSWTSVQCPPWPTYLSDFSSLCVGYSLLSTLHFAPSQDFSRLYLSGWATVLLGRSLPSTLRTRKAATALRSVQVKDQSVLSNSLTYWSSIWKDATVDVR